MITSLRIPTGTCTTTITYTNTSLNGTGRSLIRISMYTRHCYTATRTIQTLTTAIVIDSNRLAIQSGRITQRDVCALATRAVFRFV